MHTGGTVYMMTSPNKGTLYIGVTSNLRRRVWQHKNKEYPNSFSARYNCVLLVYYAHFPTIYDAITEEKRLKGCSRKYKEELIAAINPTWKDLYEELM